MAFDLATHRGYDSDHPRVVGDVGVYLNRKLNNVTYTYSKLAYIYTDLYNMNTYIHASHYCMSIAE